MQAMLGTMTIRLVMITHAPTAATREARFPADEPLDARGAEAAGAAGTLRRFDRVLRGPERRCAETAAGLDLDAAVDPSLADLDLGAWRGRTLTELEASGAARNTLPKDYENVTTTKLSMTLEPGKNSDKNFDLKGKASATAGGGVPPVP